MNGFKIMLGAIGVQIAVLGLINALRAGGLLGGGAGAAGLGIGAGMIVVGVALALWPALTGLRRDLAGASSILFVTFGGVWFLQGLNRFPGASFMNGQIFWTYAGAVWVLIGLGLFVYGVRRPAPSAG
ncbi:MAG: hypothetical protein AB7L65_11555, partial [Hyphomonadaceae bacterium]